MGRYKKKKNKPPSIVPNLGMASPAYEFYFPLPIASCTVSYPPLLFMAEIFFKDSKEFWLNFKNLVLVIFNFQNFAISYSGFYLLCGNNAGR